MGQPKPLIGAAALTQVRTTAKRIAFVRKGQPVPDDIHPDDRDRLTREGYLCEAPSNVSPERNEEHHDPAPRRRSRRAETPDPTDEGPVAVETSPEH